jgi:hypothetical protein
MVGLVLLGLSLVVLVRACSRCKAYGHDSWFSYRWDVYEHWSVVAIVVTHVSLWPLVTVGNLGALSCLDIVLV